MSKSVDFRVDIRPYSGYSDPGLPIASWIAQGGTAGDASGGILFMNFLFQRDEDPQISELFNLEQIAADTSTAVQRVGMLRTLNMDVLSASRPLTDMTWRVFTQAVGGSILFSNFDFLNNNFNPLWLGAPNRVEGDSGLQFQWPNIDLLLYLCTLQGYMWGPRSVLAEGGPRRPVGNLFGR